VKVKVKMKIFQNLEVIVIVAGAPLFKLKKYRKRRKKVMELQQSSVLV
jgi:hypothetical protein